MSNPSFGGAGTGDRTLRRGSPTTHESLTVVTVAGGPSPVRTVISPDRPWTVGRADDADIVVLGDQVSRRHLVLEHVRAGWLVRDVSSNGSWHNGTRIGPAGLPVPPSGELRLNLGDRAGPHVVIERPPTEPQGAHPSAPGVVGAAPGAAAPGVDAPGVAAPRVDAPGVDAGTGPKRRRRYRRLGLVLLVLLVLLAIADRVAARVASTQAVSQIVQKSQGLAKRPSVSFNGFPFLTQVAFGNYTDIQIGIEGLKPAGSLRIQSISAHLQGAHVPLATVLQNKVKKIPIDRVIATVGIGYADLNAFLASQPGHLKLAGRHGAVEVTGSADLDGEPIKVSGAGRISASRRRPRDHADIAARHRRRRPRRRPRRGGRPARRPAAGLPACSGAVAGPALPLRLASVRSNDNGIVASATAEHVVLDAKST